jgi:hypothetical protein
MAEHLMDAHVRKVGEITLITYRALSYPLPQWAQDELKRTVGEKSSIRDSLEDTLRESIGVEVTRRFIHPASHVGQ